MIQGVDDKILKMFCKIYYSYLTQKYQMKKILSKRNITLQGVSS